MAQDSRSMAQDSRRMAQDSRRMAPDTVVRVAYLDCFSGISGDMFLGALIDAGVSPDLFRKTTTALNIGAKLQISRVNRSGISATKIDVIVDGVKDAPRESSHDHLHKHAHEHEGHTHHRKGQHRHHEPGHQHARGLTEIRKRIQRASLSESVKSTAIAIFEKLGAAESQVHNVPVEKIHFHEVGATDAMVDIVCAAVGTEALGLDGVICSPLNVGGGTVECAHGTFPVPAPATVELLKGAPIYSSGPQAELVTPTGAAIVATLAKRFSSFPRLKIEKVGYGAGTRDFPGYANVLRIIVGQAATELAINTEQEVVAVLEANLDDLNPQIFGYVMDRLLEAGALDVFGTPVQMKKNRPGTLLTVLAKPEDAEKLAHIIFAETTTLGIRRREEARHVLARRWETVSIKFGEIRMKIASLNGSVSSYAPEYEDCRRIAAEKNVPLKMVMMEALEAYVRSLRS